MVLKKQTVWLLTMLTLMVVLSAYYLINHEGENYQLTTTEEDWEPDLGMEESDFDFTMEHDPLDFFINYRLERDALRAEMLDQVERMIANGSSAEVIAEASAQRDKIFELADKELTIESLLKTEGYEEAVVIADTDKVSVIVKAEDSLDKEKVLSIIHLVRDQLNIPGNQIFVSYR